jgi:hypothetical protein
VNSVFVVIDEVEVGVGWSVNLYYVWWSELGGEVEDGGVGGGGSQSICWD